MTYVERFEEGPGGWLGWSSNAEGAKKLEMVGGCAVSRSPWWIDYNHAPPGAGYLHLLFALHTTHPLGFPEQYKTLGGRNRFVEEQFPRDFRNARVSIRLRGEVDLQGSQCVLLVQSRVNGKHANTVLTAQPVPIHREWQWHIIELTPDPQLWAPLGSRADRVETYADAPIDEILRDVNADIILVLFPLDIAPTMVLPHDGHRLRAGEDYPVDYNRLPSGYVMMDEIRIEFAR